MMLLRLFMRRSQMRERVRGEADSLISAMGKLAFPEARERARSAWEAGDRAGDRFWSRVAVEIAARTGREVGVMAADRYEQS
jgi:hypothetical protein